MITKIEYHVEGLTAEGEWHLLDRPMGVEGDHQAHRDSIVRTLREMRVTRYERVRLMKVVTTTEMVGEGIKV